ncbi:hypothetical protein [Emticicia fontis]
MTLQETIDCLCEGDNITIFSNPIPCIGTNLLPEEGTFHSLRQSESDKYPIWIVIHQIRDGKKIAMTFALANIQSILVTTNMAPVNEIAKSLKTNQSVNITTTAKNSAGKNKEYYGQFVSYEPRGITYLLTIKIETEFSGLNGKKHFDEKIFWGQHIQKITVY